jgi:hypothetical protein
MVQESESGAPLGIIDIGCPTSLAELVAGSVSEWKEGVAMVHTSGTLQGVEEAERLLTKYPYLQSRLLDFEASPALQVIPAPLSGFPYRTPHSGSFQPLFPVSRTALRVIPTPLSGFPYRTPGHFNPSFRFTVPHSGSFQPLYPVSRTALRFILTPQSGFPNRIPAPFNLSIRFPEPHSTSI